jgi:predicted transcriptional regulator
VSTVDGPTHIEATRWPSGTLRPIFYIECSRSGDDVGDQPARRPAGALSAQVLKLLTASGRAMTPGEVQQALASTEPQPLAYTTVVTILSRLHTQGLLDRFRHGRAFAYLPVADHARLAAGRMRRVLDAEDDRETVLARFVGGLSAHDEQILRRLLET